MARTGLRQKRKAKQAEEILSSAAELFLEQGYEATRLEEVAMRASVAPATLYNYFSTKQNLLLQLAYRHLCQSLPERRAFIRNPPPLPMDGFLGFERLIGEQTLRILDREAWRRIYAFQFLESEASGPAGRPLTKFIRIHYRMLIRHYQATGAIDATVDSRMLADIVVTIATEEFVRALLNPNIRDIRDSTARKIAFILSPYCRSAPGAQ